MSSKPRGLRRSLIALGLAGATVVAVASPALAQPVRGHDSGFDRGHGYGVTRLEPGNLLVSTSDYVGTPNITAGQTQLPPNCTGSNCVTATADGSYPTVFNNVLSDSSFGVTSPIVLDELSPSGRQLGSITVPEVGGAVTSFSSKSELALNQSTSGKYVTFMGYAAPQDAVDVSNSNTPGAIDPTNPVPGSDYRVVVELGADGKFHFTETNAYSGNNGRAAVLADTKGLDELYTAGNAGNGSNPQPENVVLGAGAQLLSPSKLPESKQTPGLPTPVGAFSVTQLGDKADKIGKDTNFRGLTISNNVLYFTKGSGSNGVNTVYFLDTTGTACPNGVGVPAAGAKLPTAAVTYDAENGLTPNNMCVLAGFPTTTAKSDTDFFPFGLWFANKDTLYVAQEGDGSNTYSTTTNSYTDAASSATAGLQKYSFDNATKSWKLDYTLQSGLKLGTPYTVAGYPKGDNAATGLPWAPATDGLRNISGRVNANGTVTIWGVTSTVSGSGDQGADPNALVSVTDRLSSTAASGTEAFHAVKAPKYGTTVRGVSFTPGTRF
ncbi:hypothetical protein ACFOYW_10850 [Gryllotalpicola reticulitermitis]|uniref:DUF839 domain-containing protein n=1 Tax=Gryllotalpicola reticulitermitis TaxID=1184153 RepID=A0ABV8Q8R6_9MICO